MRNFKVIGIGEVLWDMLPDGKELGGAPANFAFHAQNLGADSVIISAIGQDKLGDEIKEVLSKQKINHLLSLSQKPTGTVSVHLNEGIPSYEIHESVAWDDISINDQIKGILSEADAICFGTLAQRSEISRHYIGKALGLVPQKALKVFDINLRQHYYTKDLIAESLTLANVLKLNSEELVILQQYFDLKPDVIQACTQLIEQFDLKLLALTNGSENSMLFTSDIKSVISTPKVKVVDTVGAGDSFTATMVMGLLNNEPLSKVHRKAVKYSAKVCTHNGATPKIRI